MGKKSLKGFIKSRHFIERQKERNVSDKDILKAIFQGELLENDYGQNYTLGTLKVTVDYAQEILITVHPGEAPMKASKLLSTEDAKKLKEKVDAFIKEKKKVEPVEDEFSKFIKDNKVKKIK